MALISSNYVNNAVYIQWPGHNRKVGEKTQIQAKLTATNNNYNNNKNKTR